MEIPNESEDLEKILIDLLYSSPNSKTMLQEMARKCGDAWRMDACLIVAGISSAGPSQIGFWHQDQMDFSLSESFLSHSGISTILADDRPISLTDRDLCERLSVQTLLGVRTVFQETVNGLIVLGKANSEQWTPDEYKQLLQASKPVSIACTIAAAEPSMNAQSQKENQVSEREGKANFTSSELPILKLLHDMTSQRLKQQQDLLEQQQQLNKKKKDIITAISDKARNPLSTMKIAMDFLRDPTRKLSRQKQEDYWERATQAWNNLNELINSIVTLDRLESKTISLHPQAINLTSSIQRIAKNFQEQWSQDRRKALILKIAPSDFPFDLHTDPQHLESILQALLTNAGHFSVARGTVHLTLNLSDLNGQKAVKIAIANTGIGIPAEEREAIYEPFYRGQGVIERGISGTGVGLAVVKGLVELLGGKIEMTSELSEEPDLYVTSFQVTLPLNPDSP